MRSTSSPRCEHQHGNTALLPQPAQNLKAIHSRQHDIQDNQFDLALRGEFQPGAAVVSALHLEAFALQKLFQQTSAGGARLQKDDSMIFFFYGLLLEGLYTSRRRLYAGLSP